MQLPRPIAFRALCLAPAILLSATAFAEQTLWKAEGEYVKIAPRGGSVANKHPLKIDPTLLAKALSKLNVEPARKQAADALADDDEQPETLPLFTRATAHRIANYIAEGLRATGPGDDVVFRSVDTAPLLGKLLGKQVLTAGRVFWRGRRLHIIFGDIHKGLKKRWLFGQEQGYLSPPEPGVRSKATALKLRIAEAPGIENAKTRDGRKRLDWVLIEPRTLAEAPSRTAPAKQTIDRSTKARLKRLETLLEEDLISEQEYKRKRRRILDEL